MTYIRVKTPFCGSGKLRSAVIFAGVFYLIIALAGVAAGFGYESTGYGYGVYGENYFLLLLGISFVIWIIVNLLLLHGAITKQYKFLVPWICWHVVLAVIALMELIWSSIVMGKLSARKGVLQDYLKDSTIAVLSCVVTFLCTLPYFFIVIYSFYRDLKGVVGSNAPNTSQSPVVRAQPSNGNKYVEAPFKQTVFQSGMPPTVILPQAPLYESDIEADSAGRSNRTETYYSIPDVK